jgi:hypothetical protein
VRDDLAVNDRGCGADVPGVGRDLLEAIGPVMAATGEHLDRLVGEVDLDPVAVELDLVDPTLAARCLFDRGRQRRFDQTGVGRLDAYCRRSFALKCHSSRPSVASVAGGGSLRAARRNTECSTVRLAAADRSAGAVHGQCRP